MRISDWSSDVCSSDLRGVNKEELVGKKHNESFYIVPAKAEEGIGLILAFYADIGLPNGGVIGAAEDDDGNQIEGFAEGIVGHTVQSKIVRAAQQATQYIKFYRMLLQTHTHIYLLQHSTT